MISICCVVVFDRLIYYEKSVWAVWLVKRNFLLPPKSVACRTNAARTRVLRR